MPWIGTRVIITKLGSPLKGYVGVVKDVLRGQDTASGLKIVLQLEHHDPSAPYRTEIVDHDGVVELRSVKDFHLQESILNMPSSRTGSSLLDYAMPRSVLFQPSKAYMKSARRGQAFRLESMPGVSTSGGATPMPDQTSSLTPAWDPLSRTPPYFYSYLGLPKLTAYKIYRTADASFLTPAWNAQPLASNSQIASKQPDRPQHPLLDERLVGAQLKVVVNDGENYKNREVAVSIARVEGVVSIRHHVYNASKGLVAAWVSSKSPNPTRDNGLLVVVKGEHCGKYVRRIHHRYHEDNGNREALMILAVVEKVEGAADTLTGEQFELGPDSLCLAFETNENKKLNTTLMTSLRENARKRR